MQLENSGLLEFRRNVCHFNSVANHRPIFSSWNISKIHTNTSGAALGSRQQNARHFWRENYWKTIAPRLRWKKTLQIVSLNLHCMTWFVVAVIVKAALASNRNAPAVVFTFWRKNLIEKKENHFWIMHPIFRETNFTKFFVKLISRKKWIRA